MHNIHIPLPNSTCRKTLLLKGFQLFRCHAVCIAVVLVFQQMCCATQQTCLLCHTADMSAV